MASPTLSKDSLKAALAHALPPGSQVLWVSVCEGYIACKLQAPSEIGDDAGGLAALAHAARSATIREAARCGQALDSFIAEFVNDAGTVIHTARFGGINTERGKTGQSTDPTPSSGAVPQGHAPLGGIGTKPVSMQGPLPGVSRVIAVGAGKGGVGKSTVALNLAVGLARQGHAVGLLDGDIYGPSMPTMLALDGHEAIVHQGRLQPFVAHGIKSMTIGKLVEPDKPLIWRGPMAHGAFKQLVEQTQWGELDYLIIDLPPGTGDVSLTMSQLLTLTGAVVVCTPQRVAQDDAVRAVRMFQQLQVPILGVVENMSCFVGDDGKVYDIFGKGGAQMMAQRLGLPFLGEIPITMSLRANSDAGNPTANFEGRDAAGLRLREALEGLVRTFAGQVSLADLKSGARRPTLTIS